MSWKNINDLSTTHVDNEIAKLIGWQKIRKKAGINVYSGINPATDLRELIPPFSRCPEAIHIAENYVAQAVGMAYIVYLGKITATSDSPASWANIQQAFLDTTTRAKACLAALNDVKSGKIHSDRIYMA
jgi:hypothetical protein